MNRRTFLEYSLMSLLSVGGLLRAKAAIGQIATQNRWVPYIPSDRFGFLALGDMGTGWKTQYQIVDQMSKFGANQYPGVLLLGDLIYPAAKAELIESNLSKPFKALYNYGHKFYPAWGNHDWIEQEARFMKEYYAAPNYYTFGIGPAQVWALNSNKFDTAQANWLANSMASSKAPWKIAMLHHSPYCSGVVHSSNQLLIKNLSPILSAYKVDLCLSGHNHLYERTGKINGVTYIVSGGGSASLHKYHEAANYPRIKIESKHHFLKLAGDASNLVLEAVDIGGSTFDRLQLSK
jgi:predicted phosphodiesterase